MRILCLAALLVLSGPGNARADAEADCTQMVDLARTIRGCSAFIDRPSSGSPLSGFLNPDFFASPKLGPAYNNRGYAYLLRGEYGRALADLDHAVRLSPNLAVAHRNRAEVHLHFGRTGQALADVERALALSPTLGVGFFTRARVFEAMGRVDEAARDFRKACEIGEPRDACQQALRFKTDEQTRSRLQQTAKEADRQRAMREFSAALTSCREGTLSECDRAERLAFTAEDRNTVADVRLLGAARARILERQRRDPEGAEAAWRARFRKMLDDDERAHAERKSRKP